MVLLVLGFQVKIPTGWDEADRNGQVRRIANGIETIEFPKVNIQNTRLFICFCCQYYLFIL